jgi:hypothetical protein
MYGHGHGIEMKVTCDTKKVLETLKTNLAGHKQIVKEARAGFIDKAKKALEEKLKQISKGNVVDLTLHLQPPQDHSGAYRTAIRMLEMHTLDTIELSAGEVQTMIADEWDWKNQFLTTNSVYSKTASDTVAASADFGSAE